MNRIGVIGGGAWGSALAQSLAQSGKNVTLWALEKEVADSINRDHVNTPFLPGVPLDPSIKATNNLVQAVQDAQAILIVSPAQHLRQTIEGLKEHVSGQTPLVICSKGIEIQSGLLMSQVANEVMPSAKTAILTGPTFASEIARGLPSAVTLAMNDLGAAEELAESLSSRTLRMYASDDVLGAQIGGAVKNVIAIACGVIHGKGLGESARAALVTRGLAEIARLGSAMGAKRETLMGMCGVGDMILTCSSMQSRNFSLGAALGEGRTLTDILGSRTSVTEGVHTAKALVVMAKNHAVDMPISEAINKCLSEEADIDEMINRILDRPVKTEAA